MSDQKQWLLKQIGAAHEKGQTVAIIGWRDSNHNKLTRNLPDDKFVFYEAAPMIFPQSVGYVLMTKFVSHTQYGRVRRQRHCSKHPLSMGVLKEAIRQVVLAGSSQTLTLHKDPPLTLVQDQDRGSVAPIAVLQSESPAEAERSSANAATTAPASSLTKEAIRSFALEFIRVSDGQQDKTLTKNETSVMLLRHFGESYKNPSRHKTLLEAVIREGGQRASAYRATAKLLEIASVDLDVEPEDPFDKARWLVARLPGLELRKAALVREKAEFLSRISNEIAETENQIQRSERAKEMLTAFRKL
jgi:hypothetical protein